MSIAKCLSEIFLQFDAVYMVVAVCG